MTETISCCNVYNRKYFAGTQPFPVARTVHFKHLIASHVFVILTTKVVISTFFIANRQRCRVLKTLGQEVAIGVGIKLI